MIRKAELSDADILSDLAIKSKAFWGYSKKDLNSWIVDLTVTPQMILNCKTFLFQFDERPVGFYILNQPIHGIAELEMLFVLPEFIGKEIGNQLITHAFNEGKIWNVDAITVLADPNAVPFYESKGFRIIDKKESSIPGRFLPIMQKDLKLLK